MITPPHAEIPEQNRNDLCLLYESTPLTGNIAEVGVYRGGSAYPLYLIAEQRGVSTYLFDTFKGIPEFTEGIDEIKVGTFRDVDLDLVRSAMPNAHFHIGVFPSSANPDLKDFSFVHIDCDQFATCKSAIEFFWPRLLIGGVIAFDDYPFPGIKKAIHDFFDAVEFTEHNIPYVRKKEST